MVKVHIVLAGNTLNSHREFWDNLARRLHAEEVGLDECDATLTFCPIVSRVGTDIGAANRQIPASKPGVLVVLHPTFNTEYVVPDTGRFVTRTDIVTVDGLFHDGDLLNCSRNDIAIKKVHDYLKKFDTEIPIQTSPNPANPPQPRDSHNGHPECLDAIQHPKYMIVVISFSVIVLFVIGFILIMTYA